MTTNYSSRTVPTTNYNTRQWVDFIMTQLLDFLCTEDWVPLVMESSLITRYTWRTIPTTSYSVRPTI